MDVLVLEDDTFDLVVKFLADAFKNDRNIGLTLPRLDLSCP